MKFSALIAGTIALNCMSLAAADDNKASATVTVTIAYPSTHTDGRFNNTHGQESSSTTSSGTHTKGRFNNTHHETKTTTSSTSSVPATTTVTEYTSSSNAASGPVVAFPLEHHNAVLGLSLGGAGVAAIALLM